MFTVEITIPSDAQASLCHGSAIDRSLPIRYRRKMQLGHSRCAQSRYETGKGLIFMVHICRVYILESVQECIGIDHRPHAVGVLLVETHDGREDFFGETPRRTPLGRRTNPAFILLSRFIWVGFNLRRYRALLFLLLYLTLLPIPPRPATLRPSLARRSQIRTRHPLDGIATGIAGPRATAPDLAGDTRVAGSFGGHEEEGCMQCGEVTGCRSATAETHWEMLHKPGS